MPLVTVICTVKNGEKNLPLVIESIIAQTLSSWEMIIVDDGSIDNTARLVRRYAKSDQRIRLVETKGVGRGTALNLAIAHSRSELIANVDCDDPSHPQRLELQYTVISSSAGFDVVGTGTQILLNQSIPTWMGVENTDAEIDIRDVTKLIMRRNPLNHSSVIMKKSALDEVGGYSETRQSQFDYDLWVRLALAGKRLGIIELPLASKRIHKEQSYERKKRARYVWNSGKVQARAIRGLGGGMGAWCFWALKLAWGFCPRHLRMALRRLPIR